MKLMVAFLLIVIQSNAQLIPISDARKLKSGSNITIGGRVTASTEMGDLTFVQDPTAAIPVYSEDFAKSVERGDSVVVTGKLAKFNSLLEIIPDSVRKIVAAKRELTPRDITPRHVNEREAELVRITGLVLKPAGHFFYPQRDGLMLKGADSLYYWIDGDTDLPGYSIPAGFVAVTGVVSRYKDQFQILPRSVADIPGLTRTPTITNKNVLSIMTWNLEFFGAAREKYGSEYGPADEVKQVDNVAKVLNSIRPDIVAVQEVSDDGAFNSLIKKLPGYEGRCSGRYSYSHDTSDDFPPQKVCFIYKTSVVRLLREKILFRELFDEAPSGMFSSGRLPYLVEVEASIDGVTDRLVLINLHGKSGATVDDHVRRLSDARLLKDTLDKYYNNKKLMLLGDFNDDLDVSITEGRSSPYESFVTDVDYTCISKQLSGHNWHSTISYDDMIDHQVVSSSLGEHYVDGSARIVNTFAVVEKYVETTSDHLPVVSEFDLRKFVTAADDPQGTSIYPNPTQDIVHVACPGYFEFTLVNSSGMLIGQGSAFDQTTMTLNAAGLYFLTIKKGLISQTLYIRISKI